MDTIVDFINVNRDRYIDELKGYLAIPSISALPQHKDDVRRCAEWTADGNAPHRPAERAARRDAGTPGRLRRVARRARRTDDSLLRPLRRAAGRSGESVDLAAVRGDHPRRRDLRRGSADDKGQVFMHFKAVEAHLKQHGRLPVNMKFLIEGEEEVGSANLDNFIRAHKDLLKADVVVISDSPMFDRGIPSICYGLRGLTYFQIDLRGSKSDLHSGSFGGAVANPAMVLAQVLAQMKDKSGRVKIDGFYDDVVALRAGRARRSGRSCRSTRRSTGRSWARRSCSARPATRRWSASGRVRPSRSTDCCRDSPATAPRRCCRRWRWRRSACGWCRTRIRRRSATCSRRT